MEKLNLYHLNNYCNACKYQGKCDQESGSCFVEPELIEHEKEIKNQAHEILLLDMDLKADRERGEMLAESFNYDFIAIVDGVAEFYIPSIHMLVCV